MLNDSSNSIFKGWVYNVPLTDRKYKNKLTFTYMSIDKDKI